MIMVHAQKHRPLDQIPNMQDTRQGTRVMSQTSIVSPLNVGSF